VDRARLDPAGVTRHLRLCRLARPAHRAGGKRPQIIDTETLELAEAASIPDSTLAAGLD
jgi:hypothetical protein